VFNRAADIAQFDLVNSRTFKDLWNEIRGLSSTCLVFKYFQGLFIIIIIKSKRHDNIIV